MLIFAVESSCDETAVAVVRDGREALKVGDLAGLGPAEPSDLLADLDETAQETRPTTPPGRRGVEPSDQISWQAYSEAVHGRGDVSDNAGAKPILP